MENKDAEIRIYVACLAACNDGIFHGRWIDATQTPDDVRAEVAAMLKASPVPGAEEYAIHDYEGFEGVRIEEYAGIEKVCALAGFIAEHGRLGAELICYYGDIDSALSALENHYAGQYRSLADFAQEITEETTAIPDNVAFYIDWERMARDLAISDVLAIETGFECVHVFWNH